MLNNIFLVFLFLSAIKQNCASPEDDFKEGNHLFSAKLYKEVRKIAPNGNIVFSPYPIQKVLAALASAASYYSSPTVTEMKNSAILLKNRAQNEEASKSVSEQFKKYNDDDFKLFDATKMYFTQGYSVQQWYKKIAQQVYDAEIETVNFSHQSDATTETINSWVSKKTDGQIRDFIKTGDITRNTQNVLVSTLYMAAKWDTPFDKANTYLRDFHTLSGTKQVNMMENYASYSYSEDQYAKYLKLGLFKDEGNADVIFVLPHEKNGLENLEANIEQALQRNRSYIDPTVKVVLPKFSISTDIKLIPILKNLGVNRLFNWGVELQGLKYPGNPYERISDVYQLAKIEVSESGVSASSATEGNINIDGTGTDKTFIADHPFVFYILIEDVVVFAGRVVNP